MSCGKLNFKNKEILIVGGDVFAYRKACEFLEDEAKVVCIATRFLPSFDKLAIKKIVKEYERCDLQGYFMVYGATQCSVLNHQIVKDANQLGIISASVHHDEEAVYEAMKFESYDDLTIALSTSGKYPAFSKTVFDDIRMVYEERYQSKLHYLGIIRDYIMEHNIERKYLLEDLLSASLEELRFYTECIQFNKASVFVFHGVKKNEMYTSILKFIKKVDLSDRGEYFAYLDEDALKEYNYFEEMNRIISLEKLSKTLKLLKIKEVIYQPMLFEEGQYYEQMKMIIPNETIAPLLFDQQLLEAVLLHYLPKGQNLLVFPQLKSNNLVETIRKMNFANLYVMKLNDPLPEVDKRIPLHVSGFFLLMGEQLTRQVFGKNGVYVRLIESDCDAEMNRKILIDDDVFIECVKQRMKKY
ncbi:MAG: hypothetical protein EOM50_02670 [Erysipelotrichia bacterium]|nr:hypothetical protein [Erysipelotrichia bacterium]